MGEQGRIFIILIAAMVVMLIIYSINRAGYIQVASYSIFVLGNLLVFVNAASSAPPYFELNYVIFVPLATLMLFSARGTLIASLMSLGVLLVFNAFVSDMPPDTLSDMTVYMVIVMLFVLFISYQRDSLETDRRQLAVESERNDLMKQFVANISHDLKTPLTIMKANLYLLGRVKDADRQQELLSQIEDQVNRLDHMIHANLTLSRLDHTEEHTLERVNVHSLLKQLCLDFTPSFESKQLSLIRDLDEKLPRIIGEESSMISMFTNLIENAVNYTPSEGSITVRAYAQPPYIMVEISDSGIGMSQEEVSHIFERFYRSDKARATHNGGSGLGLAIVKRTVELHHGCIEVDSTPDQGTTFRIVLPTFPMANHSLPCKESAQPARFGLKNNSRFTQKQKLAAPEASLPSH
ncbi:MAG: HAMP domain-containing histidine kinase [Anaerolineae bacterium]|nr:HAMP domain-containing histidine kinase [Anaerolineae bacterium]